MEVLDSSVLDAAKDKEVLEEPPPCLRSSSSASAKGRARARS